MDDNTLVRKIASGDREAFDILAGRYVVSLNVFSYRITGDSEAARDIVQDAFVHVWEKRRRLNDGEHLRHYLYLIVRNYSLNYVKSSSRSGPLAGNADVAGDDIAAQYIRTETARLIHNAIQTLPARTAEIMRLSLDGVKQEQIAERLGISLPTVKAHKSRGIKRMREILEPLAFLILLSKL